MALGFGWGWFGGESGFDEVTPDGEEVVELGVAFGVLVEDFLDQRERVVVDADTDGLEWDAVLEGEGVE